MRFEGCFGVQPRGILPGVPNSQISRPGAARMSGFGVGLPLQRDRAPVQASPDQSPDGPHRQAEQEAQA